MIRLPIKLRLANVTTIEEANAFLSGYLKEYNERFALEEIPKHEAISKVLDAECKLETKRKIIPPANHPWRCQSFRSFLSKQAHRKEHIRKE